MQNVGSVQVGARYANATVQDLLEIAESAPICFFIDRRGVTAQLVDEVDASPPAPKSGGGGRDLEP